MPRYQFIVGVSLSALEEQVNQLVNDEGSAKLTQVLYAQGTGFVGVVEHAENTDVVQTKRGEELVEDRPPPGRARKRP